MEQDIYKGKLLMVGAFLVFRRNLLLLVPIQYLSLYPRLSDWRDKGMWFTSRQTMPYDGMSS